MKNKKEKKKYKQCTYNGNKVERSRNHCCNGNVTLRSLCIGEPHVVVNNTKISRFHMNAFMANLRRRQQ